MKIIIPIQSYSDIITNSSSELFCTIWHSNPELVKKIYEDIFYDPGYDTGYADISPTFCNEESDWEEMEYKDGRVECHLATYTEIKTEFLQGAIVPYLDNKLGHGNYRIELE